MEILEIYLLPQLRLVRIKFFLYIYNIMELLNLTWYYEHPFDYELKQYVLLSYLRNVEDSFLQKMLSPHLLHLEKLNKELSNFKHNYKHLIDKLEMKKYNYFKSEPVCGLQESTILEINNIVEFSIPQISSKIDMGYKIYKNNIQLLY